MKKFLVKMDGMKSRTCRPKDAAMFGERNDGIIIEGNTQKEAVEKWESGLLPGNRYNTFYLKITEVTERKNNAECKGATCRTKLVHYAIS